MVMHARSKAPDTLSLDATPLPGAVMSQDAEKKLLPDPAKAANDHIKKKSRKKEQPHYADDGDHSQTIPI